jgi:uncharacterized protein YbbC (DUF1343 family)
MSIRLLKFIQLATVAITVAASSCAQPKPNGQHLRKGITVGAERLDTLLPMLSGKSVGIVANHSSLIDSKHLIDSLLAIGVKVERIYSPEHGFRGDGDAGELIQNQIDSKTGLKVISLYGSKKKPSVADLEGINVMLFDMQDVGLRFYTYISTMHYVMEACAESTIPFIVLDRPNPNGFFIDGPVLDTNFRSFVGLHPVPIVHGMTIGEYATMINGEGWLTKAIRCNLTVIPCLNYTHDSIYEPPVPPSPNLPNMRAILLYPSLGFFEGTDISIGRGTDFPFQVFGHPKLPKGNFHFTPESRLGSSKNPPHLGKKCYGYDLRDYSVEFFANQRSINLQWLLFAYSSFPDKNKFFNGYFKNISGTDILEKQIRQGLDADSIRKTWIEPLEQFKKVRKKYLLYPDFSISHPLEIEK